MESNVEQMSAADYTKASYLNYSLYVITERALPSISDGLKPVQRRIIYAMNELNLNAQAKFKKSARTVGDVLGKYHPHGDSACYEAMVLLAQPFNTRHTLVNGQGNWGSLDDPKSFAAMRYTEAKMTQYSDLFFADIKKDTVSWRPNFDGTLKEPEDLPAIVPNVLVNGATGIAVGMSTDILPHNLKDTVNTAIHLLRYPNAKIDKLVSLIQGPDLPTGGVIIASQDELRGIYETGKGKVVNRARYIVENGKIVITEIPYKKTVSKIIENMYEVATAKGMTAISAIDDESDEENPVRIVLTPKSKSVNPESLMELLFDKTDLQCNQRIYMNAIDRSGMPGIRGLREILLEWLAFRHDVVTRRTQHELDIVTRRLHILEGLLLAYLNIDDVIAIIRESDEPKSELIAKLGLTDLQAKAVLDIRLRQLAKLEEIELRREQDELKQEQARLQGLLDDPEKMKALMIEELQLAKKQHGDNRRTDIIEAAPKVKALSTQKAVKVEPVTILLSKKGWLNAVKGESPDLSKVKYKDGDKASLSVKTETNKELIVLSKMGKTFSVSIDAILASNGKGVPISSVVDFAAGDGVLDLVKQVSGDKVMMSNHRGYGFITNVDDMSTRQTKGKAVVSTKDGDIIRRPLNVTGKQWLAVVTLQNRLLVYPLSEMNESPKARGVKLISLKDEDIEEKLDGVVDIVAFNADDTLVIQGARKHTLKPDDWLGYQMARARRGKQVERKTTKKLAISVK